MNDDGNPGVCKYTPPPEPTIVTFSLTIDDCDAYFAQDKDDCTSCPAGYTGDSSPGEDPCFGTVRCQIVRALRGTVCGQLGVGLDQNDCAVVEDCAVTGTSSLMQVSSEYGHLWKRTEFYREKEKAKAAKKHHHR